MVNQKDMLTQKSSKKTIIIVFFFIFLALGLLLLLLYVFGIFPHRIVVINRQNPDDVLQAYFDAWSRSDWATQASLMDKKYGNMTPEPVRSINILNIRTISSSASEKVYSVVFEIQVKGSGISMHDGRYEWSYYLTWNPKTKEWLITNYGAG